MVVESHAPPHSKMGSLMAVCDAFNHPPTLSRLITIHPALAKGFFSRGIDSELVRVVPDGVDLKLFRRPPGKTKPRNGRFRVTYAGSLETYKGINTIIDAARLLPEVSFSLIGGQPSDQERVKKQLQNGPSNVVVLGCIPHTEVPQHLWNSDALLMVPSGLHESASWTSPVKLGECLASGTPTVVSSIPALKHWLSEEVIWTPPDDASALAHQIMALKSGLIDTEKLLAKAQERAATLSYKARAAAILQLTEQQIPLGNFGVWSNLRS